MSAAKPTLGASEFIAGVHERGGVVGVVSGGFHEVLDHVAPRLGVDRWRANRLAASDDTLSGTVEGEIVDAEGKAATLREWAGSLGLALAQTIAVGDGANDLRMMATAGLGVAFNAKPAVRERANVVVDPVDLREILPLLPR